MENQITRTPVIENDFFPFPFTFRFTSPHVKFLPVFVIRNFPLAEKPITVPLTIFL